MPVALVATAWSALFWAVFLVDEHHDFGIAEAPLLELEDIPALGKTHASRVRASPLNPAERVLIALAQFLAATVARYTVHGRLVIFQHVDECLKL